MSDELTPRLAVLGDRPMFNKLWRELCESQRKFGSDILPTPRTLAWYESIFRAYTTGQIDGIVLLVPDAAVLMWGDPGPGGLPYDSSMGRVASGFGTYVRPAFRGKGLSRRLREDGAKLLLSLGFNAVTGGVYGDNDAGIGSVENFGRFEKGALNYFMRL